MTKVFTFWSLQQKEAELRETSGQLHEAEKRKEKVGKEMGTIRQDIDTQKVRRSGPVCALSCPTAHLVTTETAPSCSIH